MHLSYTWKVKVEADDSVKNYPYQMILKRLYLPPGQAVHSRHQMTD